MNRILFYAPKLGFIGACWVLIIALETWNQLHTLDDPTHSATNTLGGYIVFLLLPLPPTLYSSWASLQWFLC